MRTGFVASTRFALIVAVAVGGLALATPTLAVGCAGSEPSRPRSWTDVTLPPGARPETLAVAFGGADTADTLYVAAPSAAVTPGLIRDERPRSVLRSRNGGCDWQSVLSLDELQATSRSRIDPSTEFLELTISARDTSGGRTVFAFAADPQLGGEVAAPVLLAISRDDGASWSVREAGAGDATREYPAACGERDRLAAGVDSATVYLRCRANGWAVTTPGICNPGYYITRDAGATWQVIRSRAHDAGKVSATNPLGCGGGPSKPRPDRVSPGVVWDLDNRTVSRSTDDGRNFAPFAVATAKGGSGMGFDISSRGGKRTALLWNGSEILVSPARGSEMLALKELPIPASEKGFFGNAMFVPGTGDVVAFYTGADSRARVFRYSSSRRTWAEFVSPPTSGSDPAWSNPFGAMALRVLGDGRSRAFYVVAPAPSNRVLRMTL